MIGKITGRLVSYNLQNKCIFKGKFQTWKSWYFMSTYLSTFTKKSKNQSEPSNILYWIENENNEFIEGDSKEYSLYLEVSKEYSENKYNVNFVNLNFHSENKNFISAI